MHKHNDKDLVGHPSDYGSRTLAEKERAERGEIGRTADGDPRIERGTADSAVSRDASSDSAQVVRSDDLQGDTDFDRTNADADRLLDK
jgi:hypothetical protein